MATRGSPQNAVDVAAQADARREPYRYLGIPALLALLLPGAMSITFIQGIGGDLVQLLHAVAVFVLAVAAAWAFRRDTWTVAFCARDCLLLLFVLCIPVSWLGNTVSFASLEPFVFWVEALVFYLLLATLCRDGYDLARLELIPLALALCVAASNVLGDYYSVWGQWVWPFSPFRYDANTLATLTLPGLFISLYRLLNARTVAARLLHVAFLALLLAAVVRFDSRAAWLGLAASGVFGVLVYSKDDRRGVVAGAVGIRWPARRLCLVLLASFWLAASVFLVTLPSWFPMVSDIAGESIGGRLRRWANGMMMVREHFPFGVGAGNWLDQFPRFRDLAAADPGGLLLPFNTVLELVGEGGLLLIAAFALLTTDRLAGGSFHGRAFFLKCSLFCLLVVSFFHASFQVNTIVLLWATVLLLLAATKDRRPDGWSMRVPVRTIAVGCALLSSVVLAFTVVASHASIRSAVIVNHLVYMNDAPAFSFPSAAARLPAILQSYLKDVDYRSRSPESLPEGRFSTGLVRNTYSVIGARELEDGRCAEAKTWFDAALRRNPYNVGAMSGLCACAVELAQWADARRHCAAALEFAPLDGAVHENLALTLMQEGDWSGALEHLLEAEQLVRNRIGDHEFGRASIRRLSHYLNQRKRIKGHIADLHKRSPIEPDREYQLRNIAETAEVHKAITVFRGRILFSSNDGGGYNLWRINDDGADPQMLSNDALSPFRLSANSTHRSVFFVSDRSGDYQYSLYAMDLVRRTRQLVAPLEPTVSVAEYAVSPDGSHVAYVEARGRRRILVLHHLPTGEMTRLPARASDYGELTWSDDGSLLGFVSAGRDVAAYSLPARKVVLSKRHDAKVVDLEFAPDGRSLFVLEQLADETSRLGVLDMTTGSGREIETDSRRLVSIHAAGKRRLLVRVFDDDRYRMESLDHVENEWREAGPRSGVAYAPVTDPDAGRAYYLYIGVDTPVELVALDLDTLEWRTIYHFSSLSPDHITPFSRFVLDGPADGAPYYFHEPEDARDAPIVIWLHGTHSSFSPRWHKYAQYFAASGFAFAALNFSGSTGLPRPDLDAGELRRLQVEQVRRLVGQIRSRERYRNSPLIVIGVSFGTLLADATFGRYPDLFDAAVEYSPLKASSKVPPHLPYLVFAGENDAYADLDSIRSAFSEHPPFRILRIFPDEGHDLRHEKNITERLESTAAFIRSLSGRTLR